MPALFGDTATILETMPGTALERLHYQRPFDFVEIPDAHYVILADYVTTDDGSGLVHQAPAFGADDLVTCRAYGLPGRQPGPARRPLRRRRAGGGRHVLQEGRRDPRRRPRAARPDVPARALRARLPALLALPHAAHLLRAAVVVHPHHGDQGRAARAERADQLVPRHHQVGPLRRLAHQQRRLGAVAQPLLGHAAAHLALPGGPSRRRRLPRRAERARRTRRHRHRPAPPLRRRHHRALPRVRGRGPARARGHRRLVRLGRHAVRRPRATRTRTRTRSPASTRPTSSARPSTRRAAGSTR